MCWGQLKPTPEAWSKSLVPYTGGKNLVPHVGGKKPGSPKNIQSLISGRKFMKFSLTPSAKAISQSTTSNNYLTPKNIPPRSIIYT